MTASAADVVCVRCSKSEVDHLVFQQHHQLAQATSGVNPKDFQRRDLDQQHATSEFSYLFDKGLCRENDFLRVGTIYGGHFHLTRAVGIGSNEKCLQRAMNVAIAFTLFKKRGVKVPDHLALLLEQVSPLAGVTGPPSRGSAAPASPEPVPVKAMPPPPPAAVAGPAMSLVSAPVAIELHSLRQRVANLEDIVGQLYRYRSKADAVIEKLYEKLHKAEEKPLEDRPTRSSSEERDGDGHATPFASLKGAAQALAEAFGASKEEAEEETMKMMKEEPDFEEEPELPAPPVPEAKPELPETLEEEDEEELVVKAELSDDGSVQSLEVDDIYFSQDSCSLQTPDKARFSGAHHGT